MEDLSDQTGAAASAPAPPAKSLSRRLLDGTLLSGLGFLSGAAYTFLINTICARQLGLSQFARFGVVSETVIFASALAAVGSYDTAVRYMATLRRSSPEQAGRLFLGLVFLIAVLTSGLAAVFITFAEVIAERYLHDVTLAALLRLVAVNIVFLAMQNILSASLQGLEAFRSVTVATTIANLVALPFWILLGLSFGLTGWVAGSALNSLILCVILFAAFLRVARLENVPFTGVDWRGALQATRDYGLSMHSQHMLEETSNYATRTLLFRLPGGVDQFGLIRAGRTLLAFGPLLQKIIGNASLPIITEMMVRGDRHRLDAVVCLNLKVLMIPSIAVTAGVCAALPTVLDLWLGEAFTPAWPITIVLGASVLLMLMALILRQPLCAAGLAWRVFWVRVLWGGAFVGSFAIGLWRWQGLGFAYASLTAELLHASVLVAMVAVLLTRSIWRAYIQMLMLLGLSFCAAYGSAASLSPALSMVVGGSLALIVMLAGGTLCLTSLERELMIQALRQYIAKRRPNAAPAVDA